MIAWFDRWLCRVNGLFVGVTLVSMLVLVFYNVVARYFFSVSYGWIEEITRYMMIWLVFIGAGMGLREGMHVAVTLFADLAGPARPLIGWIAFALTFAFFCALAWYGWEYVMFASRQRSAMLQLPMWTIYLAVPVGALLCAVHLVLSVLIKHDDEAAVEGQAL